MPKRKPVIEPQPRRIIIEQQFGHWSTWFAGHPETAFGGDSPGTAVDRLWGWQLEVGDAKRESQS